MVFLLQTFTSNMFWMEEKFESKKVLFYHRNFYISVP